MTPDTPFLLTQFSLFILLSSTTITSSIAPSSTTNTAISLAKPASVSASASNPSTSTNSAIEPSPTNSTLAPEQLRALQLLNISVDPCSSSTPFNNHITCDSSKPFRHLLSLRLSNCSKEVAFSSTALEALSTLKDMQFINCAIFPIAFPTKLSDSLLSFTCINCFKILNGHWLSQLHYLTDLSMSGVTINASDLSIILNCMKYLHTVSLSHTNLKGHLPKKWNINLTRIDLSGTGIKGNIPDSLTSLKNLEYLNLSRNSLDGVIPGLFGDLKSLKTFSLAFNSLSGSIPDSMAGISGLVHLDLGSNKLNGPIPAFLSEMKQLKYLSLEKNNFEGTLPFNESVIKRFVVFKVGKNHKLCYNRSDFSSKCKLGLDPCDEQVVRASSIVILCIAVGLSSIVFFIIFLVVISKRCK